MASNRLSRRDFLRLTGAAGGAAVLAACGAPEVSQTAPENEAADAAPAGTVAAAPASNEAVKLIIWNADWGKDYNDPMVTLSDAFTKDVAPNVTAEWTFIPKLTEKLAAAVAAGNAPDVAIIDEGYGIPKMAKAGGLLPLDTYFSRDAVTQGDFIPFTWETIVYKGKPYGIPGGVGAIVLMYDKAVFKEAGIDPESVPDTPSWGQFEEWNRKLVKKDANGKITRVGLPPTSSFEQWAGVLGISYYNADRTKLTVNSPETVAAVEKWAGLLPEGVPYDDISNLLAGASTNPHGALAGGIQGIATDGYWAFLTLDKYWPELDYGMTKLPTPNGTKEEWKLYTGWVWNPSIPKGSKHPEEAWAFMKYGFRDHGAMLADTVNWTSALKEFPEFEKRTLALMGEDNREEPYLHHFTEAQYAAEYFVPYTGIYQKLNDAMGQAVDQVLRGQTTAKEALDDVAVTLQPELDRAVAEG